MDVLFFIKYVANSISLLLYKRPKCHSMIQTINVIPALSQYNLTVFSQFPLFYVTRLNFKAKKSHIFSRCYIVKFENVMFIVDF